MPQRVWRSAPRGSVALACGSPSLWYVAVAGSTVAIPILAYAVSGDRLDEPLARLKDWMERQHAALVAAILIVIGLLVLYKGIHGL